MSYMRTVKVNISEKHPLYGYAQQLTALANNLSNAARFRQRQLMTAAKKEPADWTANEQEVMDELYAAFPEDFRDGPADRQGFLNVYGNLEKLMRRSENPDYFAEGFPRQCSQQVLKQAARDMKAFFESLKAYQKNPSAFTGKPQLPGYKRKGGHCTVTVTNQDCKVSEKDGMWYAAFPLRKDCPLAIGHPIPDAVLKEATITPDNGRYRFCLKFEVMAELPPVTEQPGRVCAIDFGVDNLMAVTNNCGLPCLIYKGGVAKSINQKYNKTVAEMVSRQTAATGKKYVPDAAYHAVTNRRNDQIGDFLHKCAKHFITWCVENRIDAIVLGVNKYWKQEVTLGDDRNQNFVQIPFLRLRRIIGYLAEWNGIRCIEQEESYTSKASFPDMDAIPVYQYGDGTKYRFSGKRHPSRYKGMYRKDGFRGLYKTGDRTVINSDLNGSANILRKALPEAFNGRNLPDFNSVEIIRHPDLLKAAAVRKSQLAENASRPVSRSRQKRLNRKSA